MRKYFVFFQTLVVMNLQVSWDKRKKNTNSLSLAVHHSSWLFLLLLVGVATILRTEVDVLIIMVAVMLESMEVVIGDDTDVMLVSLPRSSEE